MAHNHRVRKHGDPQAHIPIRLVRMQHSERCTEEGCERPYHAGGFCKPCYKRHHHQKRKHTPGYRSRKRQAQKEAYWRDPETHRQKARERHEKKKRQMFAARLAKYQKASP